MIITKRSKFAKIYHIITKTIPSFNKLCYNKIMKDIELLAPAGSMEALKSAIYNGANAVYLGIGQFNARNNLSDGFNLDNLRDAVELAHLYDVKVYLAINILFKDEELQSALDVVVDANNIGVDAFIVQDLGLAYLIHKNYSSIELHASTQMAVHNLEGVKVLEKLGFTRVVLARETSKEEIKRIADNSSVEIEFFTQGALCVSFSGNCYMCSHLVNKSGNRGVCQQFCRLPYTFECGDIKTNGFLLSAKDISMLDELQTLKQCGVTSLKIEGRARRPYYVAQACRIYRQMLDFGQYSKQDLDNLKIAFNRGYTPAYFNGNDNIISKIQGNNGLLVGKVVKVNKGKKFNEIFITSNYALQGKCGIKFTNNGEEVLSIGAYDITKSGKYYRLTTTANVKEGYQVNIIQDEILEEQILKYVRKLPIKIKLVAIPNQPIHIVARYLNTQVEVEGEICQKAKTISLDTQQMLKQLSRSDVFEIAEFDCNAKDVYILNSTINKLRNLLYDKLKNEIITSYHKLQLIKIDFQKEFEQLPKTENNKFDFKIVNDVNNLPICQNLILDYDNFDINQIKKFDKFCAKNQIKGYIDLPNFATIKDIVLINKALSKTSLGVVANNLYAIDFDCNKIGGQFLNVYNSFTLFALNCLSKFEAMFVEELDNSEIDKLMTDLPIIKREKVYMTLLHCPFKQNVQCQCNNCGFSKNASYTINSGKKFKISRKKTASCIFLLKD